MPKPLRFVQSWAARRMASLKRSFVLEKPMKLSARNILKGRVVNVTMGQTTAHVRLDIGSGVTVTASITNEAVSDLQLKAGDTAYAVIKASDVMIGKD
jgi:molybdopterin-binding protein